MSHTDVSAIQKHISADRQQVLKVLSDYYGVNHAELEFLAQGYSHKSYTFGAPILGGKVVVKISHPGKTRADEDIQFESLVTDFLDDHAYPAQNAYKSLRGRYFERSEDGRNVQVLRYLDEQKSRHPNHKQKIYESGRLLSRFHKLTRRFKTEDFSFEDNFIKRRTFFLRSRLEALENNLLTYRYIPQENLLGSGLQGNMNFLMREYREVSQLLKRRRKNLLPKYLIHGDYNTGNLIFNGSQVSGVIDFEHCALGPLYWDIGFAIAHWSFLLNSYGVDRITNYFVAGYAKDNGRLSLSLVRAFRSFSALWRLSDAIRYFEKYKDKAHWESEVGYYLKKCRMLKM